MKNHILETLTNVMLKIVAVCMILGVFGMIAADYITYTFKYDQIIELSTMFILVGCIMILLYIILCVIIVKK